MTQAVAHLLEEVDQLSADERAELADLLIERVSHNVSPKVERSQLFEVRRRIREVESSDVSLVDGATALALVRQIVALV
jgi:hypothetical protein